MKSLYFCKCGKTFYKNSVSATTGFRMPDYGPGHECYGCPFAYKILTWAPTKRAQTVSNFECRSSKLVRYDSFAALSLRDKCVGRVYSLDFDFLHQVRDYADSLPGIEPDRYAFSSRPSDYGSDGRYMITIYPTQNKSGIEAKQTLFNRFFNKDGSRKDLSPGQEKAKILSVIDKSIKEARQLNTYYAPCGQKFNRSAGRVPEVTIEVTGTTANCFCCPHATHEPGDDRQGPKTFCVCTRRQVADSNRENETETEKKEIKHMGKLNLANISAGLNSVKSITENLDTTSHSENVPAELIFPAEDNPYAEDDTPESLNALAENIRTNGLISPLAVNKISPDEYRLISGERRYKAITQYLHWKTIPCMVYDHISPNSAQLKLHAANLEVREYSTEQKLRFYTETNKLLHSMKESGEYTGPIQKGVAELLGVSDRQVRKYQTITEKLSSEQQQAVIRGEVSINEASRSVTAKPLADDLMNDRSGTSSAFTGKTVLRESSEAAEEPTEQPSERSDIDHEYWDDKILAALKYHFDQKKIYIYYLFHVPTTAEAIKDKLKPAYGYSGGNMDFSEKESGFFTARSQKVTIQCGRHSIELTYSQVDDVIRKAIRDDSWISADEAKAIIIEKYKT